MLRVAASYDYGWSIFTNGPLKWAILRDRTAPKLPTRNSKYCAKWAIKVSCNYKYSVCCVLVCPMVWLVVGYWVVGWCHFGWIDGTVEDIVVLVLLNDYRMVCMFEWRKYGRWTSGLWPFGNYRVRINSCLPQIDVFNHSIYMRGAAMNILQCVANDV